jgi:hypothetical protein
MRHAAGRNGRTQAMALAMAMMASVVVGCADGAGSPTAAPGTIADARSWTGGATVAWNEVTRGLVKQYATGAAPAIRVYALVSVAQDEAAQGAFRASDRHDAPSEAAAVAAASATVLTYLYPNEAAQLEARLADGADEPRHGKPTDWATGVAIGREAAAAVVERAKGDRFFAPFTGTVPVCDACWRAVPTGPAFATLGQAQPFYLASGSQFRPAPPPAFGSPAFLADLAEVRAISDARTPEQDSIARYWSLQGGTVTPQGYWNVVASELIARHPMSERRAAHIMAVMNAAAFDVIIASHEAKYQYWLLRPTQADPMITLPIALPSFPSYPSNHAALSAASAEILGAIFPSERRALADQAVEAGVSRVYGGIHYRFDSDAGIDMGQRIARYVLRLDRGGRDPIE